MALVRKHAVYWLWLVGGFAGLLLEVKVFGNDSGIGLGLGIALGAGLGWALVP